MSTTPWSSPDDVPPEANWVRLKEDPVSHMRILGLFRDGFSVLLADDPTLAPWSFVGLWEWSSNRKDWHELVTGPGLRSMKDA